MFNLEYIIITILIAVIATIIANCVWKKIHDIKNGIFKEKIAKKYKQLVNKHSSDMIVNYLVRIRYKILMNYLIVCCILLCIILINIVIRIFNISESAITISNCVLIAFIIPLYIRHIWRLYKLESMLNGLLSDGKSVLVFKTSDILNMK